MSITVGVEKRDIFCDEGDYFRFMHDLYEFNDSAPTNPNTRRIVGGSTSNNRKRDLLAKIICYCLMPNHYHLLLAVQKREDITKFMQKLGTGYTMYFNEKYDRVGSLFQGRYKSIIIEHDEYLKHLSRYIHLNPVVGKVIEMTELEKYRFSSYPDYAGATNFPSIINKAFLEGLFDDTKSYKKFVEQRGYAELLDKYSKLD